MPKAVRLKESETPPPVANEITITVEEIPEADEPPPSPHSPAIAKFVSTFIYDLDVSPTPGEEDAAAIQRLGWSLRVSSIRLWVRKTFPKVAEFLEAPTTYPGRRVCAVHDNIAFPVLFNLHDLILGEIRMASVPFCSPGLKNKYLTTFRELNRIWNKEYCNTVPVSGAKQSHRPLQNHPLYQENHCAGCCLRRILSDYNIVAVLLVAVHFKELQGCVKGLEVTDYLEASWEILTEKLPQVLGSGEDAIRARDLLELAAIILSEQSKALKKGRMTSVLM